MRRRARTIEALESRRVLATYFVDTTVDTETGTCAADNAAGNTDCSIRSAILAAEANPGPDTIQIPAGTYIPSGFGSYDLEVSDDIRFVGNLADPSAVVIDGNNQFRLFDIFGDGSDFRVSFEGMTLQNGRARDGSGGAAINSFRTVDLSINKVVIQNNLADFSVLDPFFSPPSSGGGIDASGNVTIRDSIIRDNIATRNGGGIDFSASEGVDKSLVIIDSTIVGNSAGDPATDLGVGGGLHARGANATVVLQNVEVVNNSAGDSGGGVYTNSVSATVFDSTFTGNMALGSDSGGGGLYILGPGGDFSVFDSSFTSNTAVAGAGGFEAVDNTGTIRSSTFSSNRVTGVGTDFDQGGGAIAIISQSNQNVPSVSMENLTVTGNEAPSAGGIAVVEALVSIRNSNVSANQATGASIGSAGGIGAIATSTLGGLTIEGSTIDSNTAVLQAGGVGAIDMNIDLSNTVIRGNVAQTGRAGGVGLGSQGIGIQPLLIASGVTISNNQAEGDGGGIGVDGGDLSLSNTTVSGNRSLSGTGGGIGLVNANPVVGPVISFSTIASNQAVAGSNIALQNSDVTLVGSLFADGTGAAAGGSFLSSGNNLDQSGTLGLGGTGDLSGVDPLIGPLQDNGGPVPTHALLSGSPAIDAGPGDGPSSDARGAARPLDGDGIGGPAFDIGAFELDQAITVVVDNTGDIDDGDLSPGNLSLREAIRLVNENGAIESSTISFDATVFSSPQTITLAGSSLTVNRSVDIIGPGQDLLTISGDDQSRVLLFSGNDETEWSLSGVTLTNGRPNFIIIIGGAIYVPRGSLTINDSTIRDSFAGSGGGLSNQALDGSGTGATVVIRNSTITGNRAFDAAGIDNVGPMTIIDSTISNNQTYTSMYGPSGSGYGGGIRNSGTLTIQQSLITGNSADEDGAGIENSGDLALILSEVSGNTAGSFGGGIAAFSGTTNIIRSSIANNTAGDSGGGVFNSGANVAILDSTVSGNQATDNGGGVFNYGRGIVSITNSTIGDNQASGSGGGIFNGELSSGSSTGTNAVVITNSSIVDNLADADDVGGDSGGGIFTVNEAISTTTLFNSIVAGNLVGASTPVINEVSGNNLASASAFNLVSDPQSAGGLSDGTLGNIIGDAGGVLPLAQILDPVLTDNGGPTQTYALVTGSPAIDAGDSTLATTPGDDLIPGTGDANEGGLIEDQRGDGFPRIRGAAVDVGAIEAEFAQPRVLTIRDIVVDEGAGTATVSVQLNAAGPGFAVDYATNDITATEVFDYVASSGSLTFAGLANEIRSFDVSILDDSITELDESLLVSLSNLVKSSPTDPDVDIADTGIVEIIDDDFSTLIADISSVTESSGPAVLTLTLSGAVDESFNVDVSTIEFIGEAVEGVDFTSGVQTLNFSGFDGESQSFSVEITPDAIVEGDELFGVEIGNIDSGRRDIRFPGFASNVSLSQLGSAPGGSLSGFTGSRSVAVSPIDGRAYVADTIGMIVYDVTDPTSIAEIGRLDLGMPAFDVKVAGDVVYLAAGINGLLALNVQDPSNVQVLDSLLIPGRSTQKLELVGNTLFVGDELSSNGAMRIVDVSDPANLTELGAFNTLVADIDVVGNLAYVAAETEGVRVLDISDPSAISQLGQFATSPEEADEIEVLDGTAYVGTGSGITILDINDPGSVVTIGSIGTGGRVSGLSVNGEYDGAVVVTVSDQSGELQLLDAVNPSQVRTLGSINPGFTPARFDQDALLTYVASFDGGLATIETTPFDLAAASIINDDTATLTLSDVTVDESAGSVSVTVTLDNEVQDGFSYEYTTNDGTATAGSDYTTTTGSFSSGGAGEQQTIVVPILADGVAEIDETFTVSLFNVSPFGLVDPSSINATGVGTVTITEAIGGVDLAITKSDDIDPVQPGDDLTYTITVTNNGTDAATGVTVVDVLPEGVTYQFGAVDGDESRVSENASSVTADVGDLAVGQSATIVIQVNVESTATHPLPNTASVSANEVDIDPSDNVVTEQTGFDFFVAVNDLFSVSANSTNNPLDVLANDRLGLNGPVVVVSVQPTGVGSVSIALGAMGVLYTPPAGFNGQDSFSYTIQDSLDRVSTATVLVDVSPVALPSIFGHIYCDQDGFGEEDAGEQAAGVRVFLDLDGDRIFDAGERSTLTDTNGDYRFDNVTESAVTVVAEVPDGCNTIPFTPGVVRSTVGVGDLARSIAKVDIDDDGDLDLLVASDLSNSLAVLVNQDGNFTLQSEIPLGDRPQSVTAWLDDASSAPLVAVAAVGPTASEGSLFVFELGGPIAPIPFEAGNGPIDVVIDDFNLNGQPDVLVGTLRSSEVLLFLDGEEEPEIVAVARQVRTVASGDVNNDGIPDIVVGGYGYDEDLASELSVHLGDGTGAFGEPIVAEISQKLIATHVGELTSDPTNVDDTRVMALSASGEFKVFALEGDVLTEIEVLEVTTGSNAFGLGDFNRDGLTDLAISSQSQQLIDVFVGDGDGGFIPILSLDQVAAPSDLVVGDLDNDGQADDLAVTNLYQDARAGLPGPSDFFLPSATTILRLDVSEFPVVISDTATRVDFVFQSADPEIRMRMDVSGDGFVTALDALRVINALPGSTAEGESPLADARSDTDVNGDGQTSAVDALMIINFLGGLTESTGSIDGLDLLTDDEDEADRVAAVDVILRGQLF